VVVSGTNSMTPPPYVRWPGRAELHRERKRRSPPCLQPTSPGRYGWQVTTPGGRPPTLRLTTTPTWSHGPHYHRPCSSSGSTAGGTSVVITAAVRRSLGAGAVTFGRYPGQELYRELRHHHHAISRPLRRSVRVQVVALGGGHRGTPRRRLYFVAPAATYQQTSTSLVLFRYWSTFSTLRLRGSYRRSSTSGAP